jgi:RimJ/RimL family protein N-acetyltransferase
MHLPEVSLTLVQLTDDDLAAMLRGDDAVRPGIAQPPGGVDAPAVLAHVRRMRVGHPEGHWMMVAGGEAVGLCGIKARPSPHGDVEIGYGVAASRRRRGHATAAVAALVENAQHIGGIQTIVACTTLDNLASQRVLERNGFKRTGRRPDPDDGELIVWRKRL